MKKTITIWVSLLALACAVPMLAQTITFTASPSALPAGVTSTTLTWNAPGHTALDIYVSPPAGTPKALLASVGTSGSQVENATWVMPGVTFYLVDHNTSATLATVTLSSTATITVSPNPLPAGVTAVTVSWTATGSVDVHTGSASGPIVASGSGNGSAPVSNATPGLTFYLVDHTSSTFLASASILGDWNIPVANQSQCLPFVVLNQPATAGPQGYVTCWRAGYYPWISYNGGWYTGLTLSNSTSSDMAIQFTIMDANANPLVLTGLTVNGSPLTLDANATAGGVLLAHSILRFVIPGSASASNAGGQVYLQVSAKDGLSLNSIQATEDYTYTNPQGVTYSTVTLPNSWVDLATNTYASFFEESTTDTSFSSFAVKDMSGAAQTVDAKVFDISGHLLGEQTINLGANKVYVNTSEGLFGHIFGSLPTIPIVRLQFSGTGAIAVLTLQYRGQSVASIPSQPVLEQ